MEFWLSTFRRVRAITHTRCTYVYIYKCRYTHTYLLLYTWIHLKSYICIQYTHTCTHMYVHTGTSTCREEVLYVDKRFGVHLKVGFRDLPAPAAAGVASRTPDIMVPYALFLTWLQYRTPQIYLEMIFVFLQALIVPVSHYMSSICDRTACPRNLVLTT